MSRVQFVRSVWQDMLLKGGVERVLCPGLTVREARANFVRAELEIQQQHLNRLGIVHGGVLSTLIDIGGSLSLASRGLVMTGVTTDLGVTYLSSAGSLGEKLLIDCHLQKMGRSMAFTFVEIKRLTGSDSILAARGSHTKYIASALKSEQNKTDLQ